MSRLLFALSLFGLPLIGKSQWVAFNDHAATNTTHVNATRWNVFGTANGAPGASGLLKNISSGANLPVTLTIANSGASAAGTQGQPAVGTPTYNVFNGFVNFQGTPTPSVELTGPDVVTYTFSGLNTARRYNFKGTAIRGNPVYTDRWTLIEIQSAPSFITAHTANALTSNQVPALTPSQVAINTGVNHDATSGDYASWDNIQPSAAGTIVITCRQYLGTVPGGSSASDRGYSITGIRLEELPVGATALAILSQPQSRTVNVGTSVTLSIGVTGNPRFYQWYKDGSPLLNRTNSTLPFTPAAFLDTGDYFVIVTNSLNSVTSTVVRLTVTIPSIVYTNLGLTNAAWKYNQSGAEPAPIGGVTWKQSNYNDSAWSSGRGLLALETDNAYVIARTNTVLSLTDGGGNRIISYYFRNTFVLSNDPSAVTLLMSNIVDDGAVMYLNGAEVWRFNMPNSTVSYGTVASSAATEGAFTWTNLPTSLLVQGTNTVAVEVHQNSATSSDVVFGMEIKTIIPPPSVLSIVSQSPQSQSLAVEEDKEAVFTVELQGGDPHNQWYKNGVAISNAIRTTFTIPIVTFADAGTYYFVSTNVVNSVTSSPVTLTIYADTNLPALLQADGTDSETNVVVSFSERLTAITATNTANYKITNTLGGTLSITRATVLADGKSVALQTPARAAGSNYILYVSGVRDLASPTGNLIPANSATPIIQSQLLIAMNALSKYYNPAPNSSGGGDPVEIGTSWINPSYDEGTSGIFWADGNGIFNNGFSDVPGNVGTSLVQSRSFVDYYRTRFTGNVSPGGLVLTMTHVVDDGAIFYLNGQEFYRFNMEGGTLSSNNTRANVTVGNPARVEVSVPGSLVVTGENVLAVSVHQAQYIDVDRTFGVELKARAQSYVAGPVLLAGGPLDVTVVEGQTATFSVASVGAFKFRWQSNTVAIASATNSSYTTPPATIGMNGTVYRVGVSNAATGLVSSNATLRVLQDSNAPTIVSAFIGSNSTTIVVSFSEPMAAAAAQTLANYAVINAVGGNVSVIGASLVNGTNVVLSFGAALAGRYIVTVNNVTDSSSLANRIAANSRVSVGAEYTIGMISDWKYLLINTNETIQDEFYEVGFDDSSWSGPSNALFYVEGATLPFARVTPLSLTEEGGNYINTFYFRKAFYAPIGSTNITFRLRHVVDDGVVLYLNGREIYRTDNMGLGAINAASQPTASVGDATVAGPFDVVVTNLIGGTNVFAAEVHQFGDASTDVVFGMELIGSIPSVVTPPSGVQIVSQPQSRTNAVGTLASFSVSAAGDPTIYYQWRTNGVAVLNATNSTLNVPTVQLTDNGKAYTVVVSNFVNSVTSTVATLTVTNTVSPCLPVAWTNNFKLSLSITNGTNIALAWTNPITNNCNSNAVVFLQRALVLSPPSILWTNIFTNTSGSARLVITNSVNDTTRFYQLRVAP
ncbi:MAG TPA: immunoglobulin domain-containing protein [Candidatus Acidoferrum sp.]|nr:immunoglobulin domain-containing protein [Candidatus Acidoferrum sp.]